MCINLLNFTLFFFDHTQTSEKKESQGIKSIKLKHAIGGQQINTNSEESASGANQNEYFANIFLPENEDGKNQFEEYMNEWKDFFQTIDPLDPSNHEAIREKYELKQKSEQEKQEWEQMSRCEKYWDLVYDVQDDKSEGEQEPCSISMSAIEGNTRTCALILAIMGSNYDCMESNITHDTLTFSWILEQLDFGENEGMSPVEARTRINRKMVNEYQGEIKNLLNEIFEQPDSVFRQKTRIKMYYGVTEKEAKKMGIGADEVIQQCIAKSVELSEHKTNSSVPPESVGIAANLGYFIDAVRESDENCSGGTPINNSEVGNMRYYHERIVHRKLPKTGLQPECDLLEEESMKAFLKYPSKKTFDAARHDIIFQVTDDDGVTSRTTYPPVGLTDNAISNSVPKIVTTEGTQGKGQNQKKRIKNSPILMEDMNAIFVLGWVFHNIYRASKGIQKGSYTNEMRETAYEELKYLCYACVSSENKNKDGVRPDQGYIVNSRKYKFIQRSHDPTSSECPHWGASMFIADMMNALVLYDETRDYKKARAFIEVIGNFHDDKQPKDTIKDMVDCLGKAKIYLDIQIKPKDQSELIPFFALSNSVCKIMLWDTAGNGRNDKNCETAYTE